MKLRALRKLQQKRQCIEGAFIVGVDPAKAKHQAQLLDPRGLPVGTSFSFADSFHGFHHTLWKHLHRRLPELSRDEMAAHLVFAVETSLNLWQRLVHDLTTHGFRVVLISPLTTRHERPALSGDFLGRDTRPMHRQQGCPRHRHRCL